MSLQLSPQIETRIRERLASTSRYRTADELIEAGLRALDEAEPIGEFDPGELARLIDEGERSPRLTAEQTEASFRAFRERWLREQGAA